MKELRGTLTVPEFNIGSMYNYIPVLTHNITFDIFNSHQYHTKDSLILRRLQMALIWTKICTYLDYIILLREISK